MKTFFKNTVINKFLLVFMAIIIVSNFIMPNEVHAADFLSKLGEDLIEAFFQFLTFIGDLLMQVMQSMMVGVTELEIGGNSRIQYSPGIIFLNKVAGLKVNFVGASAADNEVRYNNTALLNSEEDLILALETVYNAGRRPNLIFSGSYKWTNGRQITINSYLDDQKIEYSEIYKGTNFANTKTSVSDTGISGVYMSYYWTYSYNYGDRTEFLTYPCFLLSWSDDIDSSVYTITSGLDDNWESGDGYGTSYGVKLFNTARTEDFSEDKLKVENSEFVNDNILDDAVGSKGWEDDVYRWSLVSSFLG